MFFFVEANAEYWQTELPAMFTSLSRKQRNLSYGRIIFSRSNSTAKMTPGGFQGCCVSQLPGQVQSDFGGRLDRLDSGIKMYQLLRSEQFSK